MSNDEKPWENKDIITKYKYIESINIFDYDIENYTNTNEEETVLEYVEAVRRQVLQLFPHRQELLLSPLNEFGIRKFICTSLRPTLQQFTTTWEYKACALFVAEFLEYKALETPTQVPDLVVSPKVLLQIRIGDSLDFSIFLISLLLGSGYDAYVVSGIAPYYITTNDLSNNKCPQNILDKYQWIQPKEYNPNENDFEIPECYLQKNSNNEILGHRYEEFLKQKEKEEELKKEQELKLLAEAQRRQVPDPLKDKRVHFWIYIKKGKRDITEDVFIEPTTGNIYTVNDNPYIRIESVFNNKNYWVNIYNTTKISELDFDFTNNKIWEFILYDEIHKVPQHLIDEQNTKNNAKTDNNTETKNDVDTNVENNNEKQIDDENKQKNDKHELNISDLSNTKKLEDESEKTPETDKKEVLCLPNSWCSLFKITQEQMDTIFPRGYKKIYYHKCTLEKWCQFYPNMRGCIIKITLYEDNERLVISQIIEIFQHRKDLLIQRITKPMEQIIMEKYDAGRLYGLEAMIQKSSKTRTSWFYKDSRIDCLIKREEIFGNKVTEYFLDRSDNLIQRTIYAIDQSNISSNEKKVMNLAFAGDPNLEYGVKKLEEYYKNKKNDENINVNENININFDDNSEDADDNNNIVKYQPSHLFDDSLFDGEKSDLDNNLRKITFSLIDNQYRLYFDYGENCILSTTRIFDKETGQVSGWQSNPLEYRPKISILKKQFEYLVLKEKEILTTIRERERSFGTLLRKIQEEREDVVLVKSPYILAKEEALKDTDITFNEAHNKDNKDSSSNILKESNQIASEQQKHDTNAKYDPLAPFLPQTNIKLLNREQSEQMKEDCLRALKERLVERLNIITRRLHFEVEELEKKKTSFERSQANNDNKNDLENEFELYKAEADFRIKIIKARLAKHEQMAIHKMNQLNQRIESMRET